jgi:hypothetical protein
MMNQILFTVIFYVCVLSFYAIEQYVPILLVFCKSATQSLDCLTDISSEDKISSALSFLLPCHHCLANKHHLLHPAACMVWLAILLRLSLSRRGRMVEEKLRFCIDIRAG